MSEYGYYGKCRGGEKSPPLYQFLYHARGHHRHVVTLYNIRYQSRKLRRVLFLPLANSGLSPLAVQTLSQGPNCYRPFLTDRLL